MERRGNIVRYTIEEIDEMIARGEARMDYAKIAATTEAEIEAQAAEDNAEFPVDWDSAELIVGLPPAKRPVSLRVDADVLDWFKRTGKGYQTRMNNVLRAYVKAAERRG